MIELAATGPALSGGSKMFAPKSRRFEAGSLEAREHSGPLSQSTHCRRLAQIEATMDTRDGMEITKAAAIRFKQKLSTIRDRRRPANGLPWYPYDILASLWHLSNTLTGERRKLFQNLEGKKVADIGAADGDLSFFLESMGAKVDIIDYAPTNMNQLSGAATIASEIGSSLKIRSVDLDRQFVLTEQYDFAVFLGILYHLKNPMFVLETLAEHVRAIVLSTRVAEFSHPIGHKDRTRLSGATAYFLDASEANGDPTNYWIFNEICLKRILHRSGWTVRDFNIFGGDLEASDPSTPEGDRRAFCYLESRHFHEN